MISSASTAGAAIWGQMQQQQAQRSAEQAEQRARSLRAEAQNAQGEADQAQARARDLNVRSDQAQNDASSAKRNTVALASLNEVQQGLGEMRTQIGKVVSDLSSGVYSASGTSGSAGVSESQGSAGALIDVTA